MRRAPRAFASASRSIACVGTPNRKSAAVSSSRASRLRDRGRGMHTLDKRRDIADGVVAMQRWAADVAVGRAGGQCDRGLDAARQPYRYALSAAQAMPGKSGREPVGSGDERAIAE